MATRSTTLKKVTDSEKRSIAEALYLLLYIDQFPGGMWGASIEQTSGLYGQKNDLGSVSVGVSCAIAMTDVSDNNNLESIQRFRQYLISRRSSRGAFGMKRFIGSSTYPDEVIFEHSRHTATAMRFFLAIDGIHHEYVNSALSFLLDRSNRTSSGLWVEQGEKIDSRVDPITVATVVESLELVYEQMSFVKSTSGAHISQEIVDEVLRSSVLHIFESQFRTEDGMWLYRYSTQAERERVVENKYRYTAGILRSIVKTCRRTGLYVAEVLGLLEVLEDIARRYGGLPASQTTNVPRLSSTVNLAEVRRAFSHGKESRVWLLNDLCNLCLDSEVVAASMAPGWAAMLSFAADCDSQFRLSSTRIAELNEIGTVLRRAEPSTVIIPRELVRHSSIVRTILERHQNVAEQRAVSGGTSEFTPNEARRTQPQEEEATDDPVFDTSEEPWHDPPPPNTRHVLFSTVRRLKVSVVLATATDIERKQVLHRMKPLLGRRRILQVTRENETYYLGRFGAYPAALFKSTMGPGGPSGAVLAANSALKTWKPKALIMVGIAFGADRKKQNVADVLLAETIQLYDPERLGETVVPRGANAPSGSLLLNRFENALSWQFVRPDKTIAALHKGKLLSGSKLLDHAVEKLALIERYPGSIGGEMEAAGIWAAAARNHTEWAVLKGVCDWADGRKHKEYQEMAAAAATSLCFQVLSSPNALDGL